MVVPASASMKFPGDLLADDFTQPSLVGSVDVLVDARFDLEGAVLPFFEHLIDNYSVSGQGIIIP